MSFIHTRKHEEVGYIAGFVPIYLPLESINVPDEIVAEPGQLILGGGGGELPSLTLTPEQVVFEIVDHVLTGPARYTFNDTAEQALTAAGLDEDDYSNFLDHLAPDDIYQRPQFPEYGGDTWHDLITEATKYGYNRAEHLIIEDWLLQEAGAWLLLNRPEMLTTELTDKDQSFIRITQKLLKLHQPARGRVVQFEN